MNHLTCKASRESKWHALKTVGVTQTWLPCMVDFVLDYEGMETVGAYIRSDSFTQSVRNRIAKHGDFYSPFGIYAEALTTSQILNTIWMPLFAERFVRKLGEEISKGGLPNHPWLQTEGGREEIHSIFCSAIYKKIPLYNPEKGFEAYLFRYAYYHARKILIKEMNILAGSVSLNVFLDDDEDGCTLLDLISIDNTDKNIECGIGDIDSFDQESVLQGLRRVLSKERDWDLFHKSVYQDKTCSQIANEEGVNKSRISQRLNDIRKEMKLACETPSSIFLVEKTQFKTFRNDVRSMISESQFLEKIPKPGE